MSRVTIELVPNTIRKWIGHRELRLIACAAYRMVWTEITEEQKKEVERVEAYVDVFPTAVYIPKNRKKAVTSVAYRTPILAARDSIIICVNKSDWSDLSFSPFRIGDQFCSNEELMEEVKRRREKAQDHKLPIALEIIKDISGEGCRQSVCVEDWTRSDIVMKLARAIYDRRDWDCMPILADALEEAGCCEKAILEHCRKSSDLHVRGCWVLDLILRNERRERK